MKKFANLQEWLIRKGDIGRIWDDLRSDNCETLGLARARWKFWSWTSWRKFCSGWSPRRICPSRTSSSGWPSPWSIPCGRLWPESGTSTRIRPWYDWRRISRSKSDSKLCIFWIVECNFKKFYAEICRYFLQKYCMSAGQYVCKDYAGFCSNGSAE